MEGWERVSGRPRLGLSEMHPEYIRMVDNIICQQFIAVRKTLEANMHMADMFPPGRVLWAMRDSDLHPSHRLPESATAPDKLRLFDVLDVEKVFEQIVFARDMLR